MKKLWRMIVFQYLCFCFLCTQEVLDGDACDLIAKVAGNEPIEVVWSKDGDKLKHSKDCQITFKDNVCRLYIPEVYPDDGGKYQIDLENEFGKAMTSATLVVSGEYYWCLFQGFEQFLQ